MYMDLKRHYKIIQQNISTILIMFIGFKANYVYEFEKSVIKLYSKIYQNINMRFVWGYLNYYNYQRKFFFTPPFLKSVFLF